MNLKEIKIKRNAAFRPHSKPTIRIIRSRLLKRIEKLKPICVEGRGKYAYLKTLAKHFNVKLVIAYRKHGCYGWCEYSCRKILIMRASMAIMQQTFCHELAHILQGDVKYFIKAKKLSLYLQEEQEAEAAAIEIHKRLFPKEKINRKDFTNYFLEKHLIEICDYYKSYKLENDLFEWQKQNVQQPKK